jgi:hypothetical protein
MLKIRKSLYRDRVSKAVFLFAFMFFGLWIDGCNNCNVNGPIDNTPGDIVFCAVPLNLEQHSVFTLKKDGADLREFVQNGKMYSPPDNNHKICRLEILNDGQKNIYLSTIKNEDEVKVVSGNYYPDLEMPVLSPVDELIAFYGGDSRLLMTTVSQGMPDIITEKCHTAFIPTFSANGEFLAFFSFEQDSLFFNVVSTTSLDGVYKKSYQYLMPEYHVYHLISLHRETNRIIFAVTLQDSTSRIGIFDFNDLAYDEYIIENPFILNPVLTSEQLSVILTGSDGCLWLKDLNDPNFNALKLTENSGDELCTYVDHYEIENKILYTQLSKSGNTGSVLKILNVENNEEIVLSSQVFMGFWLRKEKLDN